MVEVENFGNLVIGAEGYKYRWHAERSKGGLVKGSYNNYSSLFAMPFLKNESRYSSPFSCLYCSLFINCYCSIPIIAFAYSVFGPLMFFSNGNSPFRRRT